MYTYIVSQNKTSKPNNKYDNALRGGHLYSNIDMEYNAFRAGDNNTI